MKKSNLKWIKNAWLLDRAIAIDLANRSTAHVESIIWAEKCGRAE